MKAKRKPKPEPVKRPVGRPSSFDASFCDQVRNYCLLGATDEELAEFFEVSVVTLNAWKNTRPEFLKAMREGKVEADAVIASRMYARAKGYEHPAVKIFMPAGAGSPVYAPYTEIYPPDTTAASFWLRNRQPTKWREQHEVSAVVLTAQLPELEIAQRIAHLLMGSVSVINEEPAPPAIEHKP